MGDPLPHTRPRLAGESPQRTTFHRLLEPDIGRFLKLEFPGLGFDRHLPGRDARDERFQSRRQCGACPGRERSGRSRQRDQGAGVEQDVHRSSEDHSSSVRGSVGSKPGASSHEAWDQRQCAWGQAGAAEDNARISATGTPWRWRRTISPPVSTALTSFERRHLASCMSTVIMVGQASSILIDSTPAAVRGIFPRRTAPD